MTMNIREPMTDASGVGYGGDDFAGTTVSHDELSRLARIVTIGPAGDAEYRYVRPGRSENPDDEPRQPCGLPDNLQREAGLREVSGGTWEQARAVVEILACQIAQTGYAGRRAATADEREWAERCYVGSRAAQQLRRVPGTCHGCNSTPCRCLA